MMICLKIILTTQLLLLCMFQCCVFLYWNEVLVKGYQIE